MIGVTACTCSAWQFDDLGTMLGTYKIPFDGVVVKARVQVG